MITQTPWTSRTFTFNQPIGVLPCTLERLRGTPARIAALISGVEEERLSRRAESEPWSVKEQIGHLWDLEELHEERIEDFLAHAATLRPADMSNRKTVQAGHNRKSLPELLEGFGAARTRLVRRFEQITEEQAGIIAVHPRLQVPMRMADMALFIAEHDDHHLAHITQILLRVPDGK